MTELNRRFEAAVTPRMQGFGPTRNEGEAG
jgi:hypothetical protein